MHSHRHFRRKRRKEKIRKMKTRFGRLAERFNDISSSRGFYRSRKGILMGVCRGIAEYFDLSVFWTRAAVIVIFLFTGFWPVGVIYIVTGLIMKLEPASPLKDENDEEFYEAYTHSRESAIQRIRKKYDNIERRIQRMEHTVTSKEFNWE